MKPYHRVFGSLVIAILLFCFSGCGGGGGGSSTTSSNWDQLVWDQGNWQ